MDWKLLFFKGQFPHRRFNPPKKMGVGQVQAFFAAIFFEVDITNAFVWPPFFPFTLRSFGLVSGFKRGC